MTLTHNRVDTITRGFIRYLTQTGQLGLLPELAKSSLRAAKTQADPHLAQVYAPIPLDKFSVITLEQTLTKLFARPIKVKTALQPDLIGGIFIRVGDKVIDLSLKTKLDTLQNTLTN